ncbi:coxsackievirus and adenovirus receptor [Oryzias latipes]|uniref:coxsackievirus and adenovirus receptor n=1 Tax=Oryzias latipes TaxID=8090 RepID=UPI0002A4C208|nr:coxsackievirus and adenovirus receptor [Oryzias latipes]
MTALQLATACAVLLSLRVSAEMVDIRAVSGQDVTLPCRAPNNDSIIAIEWFKPAEEETYLLLYRGGRILTDSQHPSYQSRVTFQKEKVKDGDASLSLRTVTEEDSGTYTCLVAQRNQKATSGSSNGRIPQTYIRLTVDSAPSSPACRGGGALGLVAVPLVLAVMVGSV